jgi:hypothetical protein
MGVSQVWWKFQEEMINWFDCTTGMVDAPPAHGDGEGMGCCFSLGSCFPAALLVKGSLLCCVLCVLLFRSRWLLCASIVVALPFCSQASFLLSVWFFSPLLLPLGGAALVCRCPGVLSCLGVVVGCNERFSLL